GFHDTDTISVLQSTQLLQALSLLEGTYGKRGVGEQELATVYIKTDVFPMFRRALTRVWNRTARKIDRVAGQVRNYFDDVGIGDFGGILDSLRESRHRDFVFAEQCQHGRIDRLGIDERLVALDVYDDLRVIRRCDFGGAIGSGCV